MEQADKISAIEPILDVLDIVNEGVYIVDSNRKFLYWNEGAARITGYSRSEVVGSKCFDDILQHIDESGQRLCNVLCPLAKTLKDGETRSAVVYLHHKQGHRIPIRTRIAPFKDGEGRIIGAIETFYELPDKTELQNRITELEKIVTVDHLTGVANRSYLEKKLDSALNELKRYDWPFGLMMIDIDHFKQINDTFGHNIGDEVLKLTARTLNENLRPFDVLGRWGGEEFLGIIINITSDKLKQLAERLRALVQQSYIEVNGRRVNVTISVGITFGNVEDTITSVVERADQCLYKSKHSGRNCVSFDFVVV